MKKRSFIMSSNFIISPGETYAKIIDGIAVLDSGFIFSGINTTNGSTKNIQILGPQAAGVRNYVFTWPSSAPSIGQTFTIASTSYDTDGDTQTITLSWASDSSGPISQDSTNIYNTSVGEPIGSYNVVLGVDAAGILEGNRNVIIGNTSGSTWLGDDNIVLGYQALSSVSQTIIGANLANVAIGSGSLSSANGASSGQNINNVCIGDDSGITLTIGHDNICIGAGSNVSTANAINQIIIGQGATGKGNNTAVIGNNSTTDVYITTNSSGAPSNLVFIGDNAAGTDFLFKIRAPSSVSLTSQREWILPSTTPTAGNFLIAASVSAGPPNITTLSWASVAVSGFTEGSVIFAGSIGTLTEKNSQLFWDNTNNRLGVGTSAPLSKLSVSGGVAIGTYAASNAAPSNGMIVSGQVLFGESSGVISGAAFEIGGSNRVAISLIGTKTLTDGSTQAVCFANPTFTPASATGVSAVFVSYPSFAPSLGNNITTAYNHLLQTGSQSGAGSVTNGYNLYVDTAGFGTNRQSLFTADLSVGVAASGIPTAGTIKTAPPASTTVTAAFVTSLTFGTPVRNTTGYDIMVNISLVVTAATSAVILLGVSSAATPSTNTAVNTFSSTGIITLSAYVPVNYYLLVSNTGSLTQTNSVVAMGI